jgi:hypothetical protein
MATALIEDPRTTLYRQALADLLRRPSCRWISFAIGTAPIHRSFFESIAAALEGLPTGEVRHRSGISHRQVQYGVRLRIAASGGDHASYDADWNLLIVPAEGALGTLDGQATLVSACVPLGLDLEARNHRRLDSECAARIVRDLYRLYETGTLDENEPELVEKLQRLAPASPRDKPFFDAAADIVRHCRATLRANRRSHPLRPGSFMSIVRTDRRERLHDLLLNGASCYDRPARGPAPGIVPRASRFLALQALQPTALTAL